MATSPVDELLQSEIKTALQKHDRLSLSQALSHVKDLVLADHDHSFCLGTLEWRLSVFVKRSIRIFNGPHAVDEAIASLLAPSIANPTTKHSQSPHPPTIPLELKPEPHDLEDAGTSIPGKLNRNALDTTLHAQNSKGEDGACNDDGDADEVMKEAGLQKDFPEGGNDEIQANGVTRQAEYDSKSQQDKEDAGSVAENPIDYTADRSEEEPSAKRQKVEEPERPDIIANGTKVLELKRAVGLIVLNYQQ